MMRLLKTPTGTIERRANLCEFYDAQEALAMGLVNKVVPLDELEATTLDWSGTSVLKIDAV